MGLGFLVVAAAMDWRHRIVKDFVWIALGAIALGFVEVDLVLQNAAAFLHFMTAATAILYFGVFFGEPMWAEEGFRIRAGRLLLYLSAPILLGLSWVASTDDAARALLYRLLTMPAMIVIAHGLYEFGMLRGGADAKAVMALALLFPGIYPHLDSLPLLRPPAVIEPVLAAWFPLAFVVLVNSALLFLVVPLLLFARNAAAGDAKTLRAFAGYRVSLNEVPTHAWLMDRIEEGKAVSVYIPRRTEDREEQLRLLREHGFEKVWVTPQLPFVTAMLVGFVLAVTVGNLLLGLFGGLVR